MLFFFLFSFLLTIQKVPAADAAETFYNGGAGATGVREMPLFVAKDFKIFDKYGLDVELISTNGGSPLVQALSVGASNRPASPPWRRSARSSPARSW